MSSSPSRNRALTRLCACVAAALCLPALAGPSGAFDFHGYLLDAPPALRQALSQRFGEPGGRRLEALEAALRGAARTGSDLRLAETVNHLGNAARQQSDPALWRQDDYWATPAEFTALAAGDCEDYALMKYFALRELGVPAERLRLTYARLVRGGKLQNHMVLAYYPTPDAEPYLLDNVDQRFLPASRRPDLSPVFSFNDEQLWRSVGGREDAAGSPQQLRKWNGLLARIRAELR